MTNSCSSDVGLLIKEYEASGLYAASDNDGYLTLCEVETENWVFLINISLHMVAMVIHYPKDSLEKRNSVDSSVS